MMIVFQSGETSVARVEEIYAPGFRASALFSDFDPEVFEAHPELVSEWGYDQTTSKPMAGVHTFVLRHRGRVILVDTGAGNGKPRQPDFPVFSNLNTPYLDRLHAAGIEREDVDLVFCTHLHVDHVGWNTTLADGRWVPTFPRARYIFGRREFSHWSTGGAGLAFQPIGAQVMEDSVLPVVEAGLVDWTEPGDEIAPGLIVSAVPGHTATQLALSVDTGGRPIIFVADSFHQPVQVFRPEWSTRYCEDAAASTATRRRILQECANTGAILVPAHFGAPYACTVERVGSGFAIGRPDRL